MTGYLYHFCNVKGLLQIVAAPLNGLSLPLRLVIRTLSILFQPLLKIENEERIFTTQDPVIFAFNHNNTAEVVFLANYLLYIRQGKKVHFVVDWMFGYIPVISWFVRQVEPIFVYNKKARFNFLNLLKTKIAKSDSYRECAARLSQNHSIAIFPEGTRNKSSQNLKHGRSGIGKIAIESGVPVVPIGIDFPKRIKQGKIPIFGSMILRVGEKLDFSREIAEVQKVSKSDELNGKRKQKMLLYFDKKVTHTVMLELAKLSGKSYPFNPPELPNQADFSL